MAEAEWATEEARVDYAFQLRRRDLARALFRTALAEQVVAIGAEDLAWLDRTAQLTEQRYQTGEGTLVEHLRLQNERSKRTDQLRTDPRQLEHERLGTVPNPDGRLRPGMFARALLEVPLTASGEAYGPELAGKFICPMHPEITGMNVEPCSICGMPLEPASTLDPVHAQTNVTLPLVIPATAPLITGKRAIVYLQLPAHDRPPFEGRSVTLGPRVGDDYLVLDGLKEGDRVVTHGNFKIDSELQIRGRPSMMSLPGETNISGPAYPAPLHPAKDQTRAPIKDVPPGFGQSIAALVPDYLKLVDRLAADDLEHARQAATAMAERVRATDASCLTTDAAQAWQPVAADMIESLEPMGAADSIGILRQQLVPLTRQLEMAVVGFGAGRTETLFKAHCPMAFDNRGADWLQAGEDIANPYFGSKMFRCGEITGRIP